MPLNGLKGRHQEEGRKTLAAGLLIGARVGQDQGLLRPGARVLANIRRTWATRVSVVGRALGPRPSGGATSSSKRLIWVTALGGGTAATSSVSALPLGIEQEGIGPEDAGKPAFHEAKQGHEAEAATRERLGRAHVHADPRPFFERPALPVELRLDHGQDAVERDRRSIPRRGSRSPRASRARVRVRCARSRSTGESTRRRERGVLLDH